MVDTLESRGYIIQEVESGKFLNFLKNEGELVVIQFTDTEYAYGAVILQRGEINACRVLRDGIEQGVYKVYAAIKRVEVDYKGVDW